MRRPRAIGMLLIFLLVAACGGAAGDGGTSADNGVDTTAGNDCTLPETVKVVAVKDETGTISAVGVSSLRGVEVALEEVEAEGLLGSTKLELEVKDPAGSPQTAAAHVTAAAADPEVVAILGPPIGDQAVAVSPIANRDQIPVIYNQAGSDGVVTGDWTFRVSPPLPTFAGRMVDALVAEGVETLGIVSASDNPTLAQMPGALEEAAGEVGIEITSNPKVPQTLQDFSAPVAQLLEDDPDAVGAFMFGTHFASLRQALDQAGFEGTVIGFPGVILSIEPVAEAATGTIWSINFDAATAVNRGGVGAKFVEAYEEKFGETPINYAAEGYDSVMWLVNAINAEGCATRDSIRTGLVSVADAGFEGAQGQLTFVDDGRDARLEAALVQWNGQEVVPYDKAD